MLHERVVFLTCRRKRRTSPKPSAVEVEALGNGIYRVKLHYGFMEEPELPDALAGREAAARRRSADDDVLPRPRDVIATKRPGMALWREKLFALIAHNATTATAFFGIPPDRVVELGEQIEI